MGPGRAWTPRTPTAPISWPTTGAGVGQNLRGQRHLADTHPRAPAYPVPRRRPEIPAVPRFRPDASEEQAGRQDVLTTFDGLPATTHETYRKAYERCRRMVDIFHAANVSMMTGTDGQGATPGQTMRLEFGEWATAGIPALDVLRAAATGPAAYLGRSGRMGRIAPGMDADSCCWTPTRSPDQLRTTAARGAGQGHCRVETSVLPSRTASQPRRLSGPGVNTRRCRWPSRRTGIRRDGRARRCRPARSNQHLKSVRRVVVRWTETRPHFPARRAAGS
ncbi:amidohydrolase family protein [Micromonospora sp. WMMD723]|uniref:amidohydrolase family protein n=1 Tax=Micromonospora sp. WMMD723 TaxID=3403465 RepID=UPI003CF9018C